jgi:hypothetical protein
MRAGGTGKKAVSQVGSLMWRPSLEAALRQPAALTPTAVPGRRRVFNAVFPDGAVLPQHDARAQRPAAVRDDPARPLYP